MFSNKDKILLYLFKEFNDQIRDPLWQNIPISPQLKKVINTQEFQQLHRIKQLGPTYLIYPGAVHSRFDHSLGVFHLSRKILISLVSNERFPSDLITLEGVKTFLTAALLHDLGHFPYTHSLKDLHLKSHERLAGEIIEKSNQLKLIIEKEMGQLIGDIIAIIDTKDICTDRELLFYRSILSGVLDPDKLDYLNRDAYFCGVPYGIQDIDHIFRHLTLSSSHTIAVDYQGIPSIEHILFSKYLMYKNVYWHKTVRAATAMMKRALYLALNEHILTAETLYGLDDETFHSIPSKLNFPPLELITDVKNNNVYYCAAEIQFNKDNPVHEKLKNYENSLNLSRLLYKSSRSKSFFNKNQIIIDLPEPISFETQIPVISNNSMEYSFQNTQSIIHPELVSGLTRSLQKIRLFLPIDMKVNIPLFYEILK